MKVLFISLGCDKNLVDSEFMLGQLFDNGYEMTDDENDAEAIIINTCCFINDAKMESIETIIEMAEYKKTGKCKVLIVCGCLAQRYADEIKEEIPEVDAVIGTTAYDELASILNEVLQNKTPVKLKDINYLPKQSGRRIHSTGTVYSYLKIAEGCNKNCTYCIIPSLRGSYRSVPMDDIVRQAAELDILYMTRVQRERFFNEEDYIRLKDSFILDNNKLKNARKDMLILHPLPRVNEISTEVDSDPRAVYFKQAQYGVYLRMALIMKLLEIPDPYQKEELC